MSPAHEPAGLPVPCLETAALKATEADLRRAVAAFAQPIARARLLQLLTSFGPFATGCATMYLVYPISCLLTLALALPTGVLLVRVFIIQHDCGHGSFFASRRANAIVGRLCSVMTLAPYANWGRQHGIHHANWNNLERDTGADIYSACLTMREYIARSRWQRFLYRLPFDTPRSWGRERRSVHMTNAALVVLFGTLAMLLGWREVLIVHLPIMVVASIVGVWLFTLQHRFETARWMTNEDWNFVDAALHGS